MDVLNNKINSYRNNRGLDVDFNPQIGCIILSDPFWLDPDECFIPPYFRRGIQTGRTYNTDDNEGKELLNLIQDRLPDQILQSQFDHARYTESLTKHRLGQGGFRIVVTDAYQRRCAITGEKTLPVLEAAHIKPYSLEGPHDVNNGILLKSDFHTLFDSGYITIAPDYHIEVSNKLYENFGNGKDYYAYNGSKLLVLPEIDSNMPSSEYLEWHNNNVYLG